MKEITFHFGAAGHPISWNLYAVYGSGYGVALAAAHTWYDRMVASAKGETPPGGQFVVELRNDAVIRSELLFDADYFLLHQEPDDIFWLCQFHAFPLEIPETTCNKVTEELRRRLIEIGFLIPQAEWETQYPDQAEFLRQFREMRNRGSDRPSEERNGEGCGPTKETRP